MVHKIYMSLKYVLNIELASQLNKFTIKITLKYNIKLRVSNGNKKRENAFLYREKRKRQRLNWKVCKRGRSNQSMIAAYCLEQRLDLAHYAR